MPEVIDPPTQENVSPGLKALFDIPAPPRVADPAIEDPTEYPEPLPASKTKPIPPAPPVPPAPDPVPPVTPTKAASDLAAARLAPDFAALAETAPVVTTDPAIDMPEKAPEWAKTPKQQEDYQKWRKSQQELHREIETLRSRVSQTPAVDTESKAFTAQLQEENKGLLARIERYNLMESPNFQREHLQPRLKDFQSAQQILKDVGADPVELERALALSGKARIDMLEDIGEKIPHQMLRDRFGRLIESIDNRTRDINERLANHKQAMQEQQKNDLITQQQQRDRMVTEFESLLSSAHHDLSTNVMPELFTKVGKPGFEWWNEAIDRDAKVAREALLESTPPKAAYAAVMASKLGTVLEMWRAERKLTQAQAKEISELKGAGPKITQDRRAAPVEKEGGETNDILGRLKSGFYKK